MASEKQLDKLEQAWRNMRTRVNKTIPDLTARVRAARNRLDGHARPGDSGV